MQLFLQLSFLLLLFLCVDCRVTEKVFLPRSSPGNERYIVVHKFGPENFARAYIQASLHADELPGLLVCHHLIKLIDEAEKRGEIKKQIIIVPYANPIGLAQQLFDTHIGRFSIDTMINFNRNWLDITNAVANRVEKLLCDDSERNIQLIRAAISAELSTYRFDREDAGLKCELLRLAAVSDIAIDLHCDSDAIVHLYTHEKLWPELSDLASDVSSQCHLTAPVTGENSFDEVCAGLWINLAERFPHVPIPVACQSTTVELRGESEVYDDLAVRDAHALFRFLQRRGYIVGQGFVDPPAPLERDASPLSAVDMMEAPAVGVMAWKVRPGSWVSVGDLLGEVVDVENVDAPRIPLVARTAGLVFSMRRHKLVRPGQVVIKVAGRDPLPWRTGSLLTI